ncbi:hypothetical protein Tco_0647402 [Tanacetum coccineum]
MKTLRISESDRMGCPLRITQAQCENRMERGLAQIPMNVGASHDLRGDSKERVPRSLPWQESFGREGERGLNPFGCAKLTTFVVMCKAYGCKPTIELFQGFFNLCRAGKWLTFAKRPEKHISHLFPKVITHIEGWKEQFFYVQNSIVPAKYPQLLLEQNKYDSKSYKDKLPINIEQNPMFQRLGRYSTSVLEYFQVHISRLNPFGCAKLTTFVVMCKAYGCKPTIELFRGFFNLCRAGKWLTFAKRPEKHISHLFPKVITQMDFRNFVYVEDEEDLSFLPNRLRLWQILEEALNMNYLLPPVKRKLAPGSSTVCATRAKTSTSKDDVSFLTISDEDEGLSDVPELKDATACHLKISSITPLAWKNHLYNHLDLELLDLHDRCYARQAFFENVVNRRSRELLEVIEKLRGECDVIKERERAREEESEGLRAKCEAAMSDFEKNPTVTALREKISTLSTEAKEHKANLDRMMLESQKWAGYQDSLSSLESQVVSLEAEKARLEAVEVSLRKKVDDVRRDRMEVVSKVVPYELWNLSIVAAMKEPFDLTKLKGYRSSYKKEHNQAGNDLATANFPWLSEFVADPSAPVEVLLSKKPSSIQRPAPSKTQSLVASSKKATSSFVRASNTMSPLADIIVVKPLSFQVE